MIYQIHTDRGIRKGLSNIGGPRPNLTQPSRIAPRGNLTESDGEDVLSTNELKVWGSGLT